jgi:hypothetical protein
MTVNSFSSIGAAIAADPKLSHGEALQKSKGQSCRPAAIGSCSRPAVLAESIADLEAGRGIKRGYIPRD